MAAQLDADPVDARVVKALGHPTRVRILGILRDRELASPVELASELEIPLGTIGYHVRRLEQLGFIELARRTQRRGAIEHHYRACAVLDDDGERPVAASRAARGGRGADALAIAGTAQAALASGGFDAVLAHADWRQLTLDAEGRAELERLLARWEQMIEQIADASAKRIARVGEPAAHRCCTVMMRFALPAGLDEA